MKSDRAKFQAGEAAPRNIEINVDNPETYQFSDPSSRKLARLLQ
jgi:hypothetical protein